MCVKQGRESRRQAEVPMQTSVWYIAEGFPEAHSCFSAILSLLRSN